MRKFEELPRGINDDASRDDLAARARWTPPEALANTDKWAYDPSRPIIGQDRRGELIGLDDDRHLGTFAGSRGGKGISTVLPNLACFTGSVLVLDPKGENANLTATRRGYGEGVPAGGMGQEVHVIDAFHAADEVPDHYRSGFNPILGLNPRSVNFIDDCDGIAEALVVTTGRENTTHWNDSARFAIRGLTAWAATSPEPGRRNLPEVHRLVNLPQKDFDALLVDMAKSTDRAWGLPSMVANAIAAMDTEEESSVMSIVKQQLSFMESPPMAQILRSTGRQPDLRAWKMGGMSIYLCLPAGRLHRHNKLFRLFLNRLLAEAEYNKDKPAVPAIMMLDEMHVLGHMQIMETAAALIAGFGVRIWSIWQDFNQLQSIFDKRWETFIGNASLFQSFALNDMKTLKYVSDRLGPSSIMSISQAENTIGKAARGFDARSQTIQSVPLLTPDEVAQHFSRQGMAQCVLYPGASPIWMQRVNFFDETFEQHRRSQDG